MLVEVVAIDAADVDALAVDEQVEPADLDPAEPDLDGHRLGDVAVGCPERDVERIEVRLLGGPRADGGHVDVPGDEAIEWRRHPGMDPLPEILVLGRQQARGVGVHDVLDLARPAHERRPVDHRGRRGPRLPRPVQATSRRSSRVRAPGRESRP